MSRVLHILALVLALAAWTTSSSALQTPAPSADAPAAGESRTLASARARWERLTPAEKERMRERYERYRALPEAERAQLAERARTLRETTDRVEEGLAPEVRDRLRKLDPERRRAALDDLTRDEARERAARIRAKLPDAWVRELEEARPEDRARQLVELQKRSRERVVRGMIDRLGARLRLDEPEVERLKALPEPERAHAVLELKKRLSTDEAERFGLPPGVSPEQWAEWQRLSPEEFFERIQRLHREREAEREPYAPGAKLPHFQRLRNALRVRPEDVLDLVDLDPAERRARIAARVRERALVAIREGRLLSDAQQHELEKVPDDRFAAAVRKMIAPPDPDAGQRPFDPSARRRR